MNSALIIIVLGICSFLMIEAYFEIKRLNKALSFTTNVAIKLSEKIVEIRDRTIC